MKTIELTAPSHWAPALINDDPSGLEPDEVMAVDAFVERVMREHGVYGSPIDCEEAGFVTYHDARMECPYAADCEVYVFQAIEGEGA